MLMPMAKREDAEEVAFGYRVGRNIQAILRAKGLSQGQLSYMTGMPTSAISQLVNGRKNPSLLSIREIARALNVSLDELAELRPLQIPEPSPESAPQVSSEDFAALAREVRNLARTVRTLEEARPNEPQSRKVHKRPA